MGGLGRISKQWREEEVVEKEHDEVKPEEHVEEQMPEGDKADEAVDVSIVKEDAAPKEVAEVDIEGKEEPTKDKQFSIFHFPSIEIEKAVAEK